MVTLAIALLTLAAQGPDATPKPKPPEPKVVSTDIKVGKGDAVEFGDYVTVDYTGTLADGTVFDSSKKAGRKPFQVVVGIGEVIKGWDQGLIGEKVGGTRKLVIPPQLAYGERGSPPTIPANSTLTFTIEVHEIDHAFKKLKIEVTKAGAGPEVKLLDNVVVRITCKSTDGTVFFTTDTNMPDGAPFMPGAPGSFPAFTLSILGMKAGEKRTVTVPSELAFGKTGNAKMKVKPDETITVDLELVSIGIAQSKSGGADKRQ